MSIPHNLKLIRSFYRKSQDEFSQLLNVSRGMVNHYELGKALPSTEFLIRLSSLTGIPVDFIFYKQIREEDLPAELLKGNVQDPAVPYGLQRNLYDVRDLVQEVKDLRKEIDELKKKG